LLPIPSESEPREPSSPTAIPKKAKWRMTDEEWRRLAQEDVDAIRARGERKE
jgi:hypothetical protein